LTALAVVVGVAVLREGAEVVLFLYGIAVTGGSSAGAMLTGGLAGAVLGGALSWLTHAGLVRLPARYLFAVIFWLVAFLAAGMAAQAAFYLQSAGVVAALSATVWDSSGLLADDSIAGRLLHTLVGYTDRPSGLQLAAYLATLLGIVALSRVMTPRRAVARK
jgi:high-affinity iron transporter